MDLNQVTIYNTFDRGLYRIGVPIYQDSSGNSISASGLSVGGDSTSGSIDPSEIASGGAADIQMQYVGAIASGKTQFTNTETGWILGVDKGIPKFYIGNATNYLNWDGSSLIVSGNISATTGTIGGFTISATDISGTGLDLNSSTPKITVGTGSNQITLDGSTGKISANNNTWILNGDGTTLGLNTFTFLAGENITAGQALHLSKYYQSDGGILFDTHSTTSYNNVSNQTKSFTVASNSNRVLLCAVIASSAPSGVTYNAITMTLIDSQAIAGGKVLYTYYLIAPTTGANNISVTGTGIYGIGGASYYNVSQASPINSSGKATNADVSVTVSNSVGACGFAHVFTAQNSTVGTSTTAATSYSSPFTNGLTATDIATGTANFALGSATVAQFNLGISLSTTTTLTAGAGAVNTSGISISLAPATNPVPAVILADSSSITVNPPKIDFAGFAMTTALKDAQVISTTGIATVSGVSSGYLYFLTDTPGSISTSGGTYGKCVGRALSATALLVGNFSKRLGSAISKVSSYTYTAECDGFLIGEASQNTTVTIGSTVAQAGATANYRIPATTMIGEGQTYIFSISGSPTVFSFLPYL